MWNRSVQFRHKTKIKIYDELKKQGNIKICKTFFFQNDRRLKEVNSAPNEDLTMSSPESVALPLQVEQVHNEPQQGSRFVAPLKMHQIDMSQSNKFFPGKK